MGCCCALLGKTVAGIDGGMSAFSAEWLDLREPADVAARAPELIERLVQWSDGCEHIAVVDLGAGTGSCLRALAPDIVSSQTWRLIDRSGTLLQEANTRLSAWGHDRGLSTQEMHNCWRAMGKGVDYRVVFDARDLGAGFNNIAPPVDLVTVSALLDLVSEVWCRDLARWCSVVGATLYTCLNYDGKFHFTPSHPDDHDVCDAINQHQRRDKGMGPALGSDAIRVLLRELAIVGYQSVTASSPWLLGPDNGALQGTLVKGWSNLAGGEGEECSERVSRWRSFRLAAIEACQSYLNVGHVDLWAWPER
ncbi:MAG TPA: SAM-dependent methyltransferase [Alphaproteobacteria bacterium]|nr:SAM-dependent methyltransferase [Alphaproteobacteria bacterium]HIO01208.1 SAM-dependent methyltransferase [Alphaproteobacteria bacterium]